MPPETGRLPGEIAVRKTRKMTLKKETLLRLQESLVLGGTELPPDIPPNGGMTSFCGGVHCLDGVSSIF